MSTSASRRLASTARASPLGDFGFSRRDRGWKAITLTALCLELQVHVQILPVIPSEARDLPLFFKPVWSRSFVASLLRMTGNAAAFAEFFGEALTQGTSEDQSRKSSSTLAERSPKGGAIRD